MWNTKGDDREQPVDTSHFHEHDNKLIPSNGVTEVNSRKEDKVFGDRYILHFSIVYSVKTRLSLRDKPSK